MLSWFSHIFLFKLFWFMCFTEGCQIAQSVEQWTLEVEICWACGGGVRSHLTNPIIILAQI